MFVIVTPSILVPIVFSGSTISLRPEGASGDERVELTLIPVAYEIGSPVPKASIGRNL